MTNGRVQLAYLHAHRVSHSWHESMMRLVAWDATHEARTLQTDGPFMIRADSGGLVEARNLGVQRFLDETDHEWLMYVDTDMGFEPDSIDRLLASADRTGFEVIGGLCFASREYRYDGFGGRRIMPVPTMYRWARTAAGHVGFTTRWDVPVDEVVQVAGTGAAFLLVHRTALEKVRAEFGPVWFDQVRYGDGRMVSEDLSFCWRLHCVDVSVAVDTSVRTTHHKELWIGTEDYRPPTKLLAADREPEAAPPAREVLPRDVRPELEPRRAPADLVEPREVVPAVIGEPRISILCPTRGRPDNVLRMMNTALATAEGPIEFVFYVDEDDLPTIDVLSKVAAAPGLNVKTIIGPRILLSECWNRCAEQATAEIMMHAGDDITFESDGWDRHVVAAFERYPDRLVFVHGDDRLQGSNLGTHGFLHRRWVNVLGYFVPPYFSSDYNDTWLTEVADVLGRRVYLPEVITEHHHPLAGKAGWDATHLERLERGVADNVTEVYARLAHERKLWVDHLRAAIAEARS
jgi:hypothetical protein